MAIRTSTEWFPLVMTVMLVGCDSPSPTAPSVVQQAAPSPTRPVFPPGVWSDYTLSGVVFEVTPTGQTPIEGVDVYCELCGVETHSGAITDANGVYSFDGVWMTPGVSTRVLFRKEGYTDPPGVPLMHNQAGWRQVLVDGDTRFDVQLVRR